MDREALGLTAGQSPPVEQGRQALRALPAAGLDIAAACWALVEGKRWWFVVVSPTVDAIGKQAAYRKAIGALHEPLALLRGLGMLTLASPSDPVGADLLKLRAAFAQGTAHSNHAAWATLGGSEVEDVYIYGDKDFVSSS